MFKVCRLVRAKDKIQDSRFSVFHIRFYKHADIPNQIPLSPSQAHSCFEYYFLLEPITNLQFRSKAKPNYDYFRIYQGKCRYRFSDYALLSSSGATACDCVHICVHIRLTYAYRVHLEGGGVWHLLFQL